MNINSAYMYLQAKVLRGGRMVKTTRGAAGIGPLVVLGAVVMSVTNVQATNQCGDPAPFVSCTLGTYNPDPEQGVVYRNVNAITLEIDLENTVIDRPANPASSFAAITAQGGGSSTGDVIVNVLSFGAINTDEPSTSFNDAGYGIQARSQGLGNTLLVMGADAERLSELGKITTKGREAHGLLSRVQGAASIGTATLIMNGGDIDTAGSSARGIYSLGEGVGAAAYVEMNGGNIFTRGSQGIFARYIGQGNVNVLLTGGNIENLSGGGVTLWGFERGGSPTRFEMTGGEVKTHEMFSRGIGILGNDLAGNGAEIIISGGDISTSGERAEGVWGRASTVKIDLSGANILTSGDLAHAVRVEALNDSNGAATVTMNSGNVEAEAGDGIFVTSRSVGYDIEIDGGAVVGGEGPSAAIRTVSFDGGSLRVGVDAIIDGSASGIAILDGDDPAGNDTVRGDAEVRIGGNAIIKGDILLGGGSDSLTIADNANIEGGNILDGGVGETDIDVLTFDGWEGQVSVENVINWEQVFLVGGADVSFFGLDFSSELFSIFPDSTATLLAGLEIDSDVINDGTMDIQTSDASGGVMVIGNVAGSGELRLGVDVGGDFADVLSVVGNTDGSSLFINPVSVNLAEATGNDVLVVEVTGSTSDGDFTLPNGSLVQEINGITYTLRLVGSDWFLTAQGSPFGSSPVHSVPTLSTWALVVLSLSMMLLVLMHRRQQSRQGR